ncbi:hypothetical protein ABI59_14570 [Acidobacteria bacterium Mor1]|nr:hypothetical protein ABI59_14570 [Acidobacteria bacterium Mor1]
MSDQGNGRGTLLRTWKEIGSHLGVSDRTARGWQKDGIPVYREGAGTRATVIAYSHELDAWQEARLRQPQTRRRRLAWTGGGALLLGIAMLAWLGSMRSNGDDAGWDPQHVLFTESGMQIIGRDSDPQLTVPVRDLPLDAYSGLVRDPRDHLRSYLVSDIGDDSEPDVFVARLFHRGANDEVWRVRHDGSIPWKFAFRQPLHRGERVFNSFRTRIVGVVHRDRPLLIVLGTSKDWYPSRLALVDPETGAQIGPEYLHPGYFNDLVLADIDQDGLEELVFAGVNNPGAGPGYPCLGVLEVPFGEAADSAVFPGRKNPVESAYAMFPRFDFLYNRAIRAFEVRVEDSGRIKTKVGFYPDYVEYTLDSELRLIQVHHADSITHAHEDLRAAGVLDHPLSADELHFWKSHVVRYATAPDGNSAEVSRLMSRPPERD